MVTMAPYRSNLSRRQLKEAWAFSLVYRENGGTLGMVSLIVNLIDT